MSQFNKKLLCFSFSIAILISCVFLPAVTAVGNLGKLSDSSFYDSNTLYVVGEVKNTGDVAVQNTNVRVVFYDSLDQKITAIEGYTDLNVILVGRNSFFNIRLLESEGSLNVKSYTIWFNWTDTAAGKPLGLVIISSSDYIDSDGHKHIIGQIQNQGTVNSNNTEVSATFYNSSGVVVGTSWAFSNPSNLAPNQTGQFDIELVYPQQVTQVARYSVTAESNSLAFSPTPLPTPSPTPPLTATPTTQPAASPSPTTSTFPSASTNPSTSASTSTSPSGSLAPTDTTSENQSTTDNPTVLIALIATIIAIILIAIAIVYWITKRKLPSKNENKQL